MRPDQRLAGLIAAEAGGCPPADLLFFRGHRPQRDGSVGPGCLSQWWPSPFAVGHVTKAGLFASPMTSRWTAVLQFAGEFRTVGGVLARRKEHRPVR